MLWCYCDQGVSLGVQGPQHSSGGAPRPSEQIGMQCWCCQGVCSVDGHRSWLIGLLNRVFTRCLISYPRLGLPLI